MEKTANSNKASKKIKQGNNQITLVSAMRKTPYILDKRKKVTFGRAVKNDIRVPFKTVDDLHASIKWDKKAYFVNDEDSTNGVFVNGKRVKGKTSLQTGDKIRIGRYVFRVASSGENSNSRKKL